MFGSISPDVNGLTFPAQFVMHNHGNTAALNVRIKAKISLPQPHYDPLAEELKTCNQAVGSGGPALFPTQDRIERISWGLGKDEIDKARRQLPSGFKSGMFLAPMLIGCVAYTYQLALPQNHATGFIYDIAGYHREHPQVWFAIDPTKTTLGVLSDIVFSEGFFAN